jgi:pimeloyl-ACP methyl ester carboxylesterase
VRRSYLAFIDTMVVWPRPRRVRTPMLVLGAEEDVFFIVREVRRTARAYRTEAEIYSGMDHDMMLDTDWHKVADRIDARALDNSSSGAPRRARRIAESFQWGFRPGARS